MSHLFLMILGCFLFPRFSKYCSVLERWGVKDALA